MATNANVASSVNVLDGNTIRAVQLLARVEAQAHCDSLVRDVLPAAISTAMTIHNTDPAAHGGVERRFDAARNRLLGFVAAGGLAGGAMGWELVRLVVLGA